MKLKLKNSQLLLLTAALFALLFSSGCISPHQVQRHRHPLLYPDMTPFVPEGRIRHIPTEADILSSEGSPQKTEEGDDGEKKASGSGSSGSGEEKNAVVNGGLLVSPSGATGESIARAALEKVGAATVNYPDQKKFNEDCSGFVRSVYWTAGIDLFAAGTRPDDNGVTAIYRFIYARGGIKKSSPLPGDLVFFQDTADTNRDGRWNDGLTHIGIVESVGVDGTVMLIHRNSRGIVREHMNIDHPDDKKDELGNVINDYIRGQPSPKLLGQLFFSYGTVLADRGESDLSKALKNAAAGSDNKSSSGAASAEKKSSENAASKNASSDETKPAASVSAGADAK